MLTSQIESKNYFLNVKTKPQCTEGMKFIFVKDLRSTHTYSKHFGCVFYCSQRLTVLKRTTKLTNEGRWDTERVREKKLLVFFLGGGDTLYLDGFALDWDCLPLPKNWKLPLVPFRVLLVSRGQRSNRAVRCEQRGTDHDVRPFNRPKWL